MRELFTKDWGWKWFSLLLAVAIWLTVHRILREAAIPEEQLGGSKVTYSNLPVLVVAAAADVHLYRVTPETVRVTVTGSAEAIADLKANQIRATVDLTDLMGIESPANLQRNVDVSVPAGITVLNVQPKSVGAILPAH